MEPMIQDSPEHRDAWERAIAPFKGELDTLTVIMKRLADHADAVERNRADETKLKQLMVEMNTSAIHQLSLKIDNIARDGIPACAVEAVKLEKIVSDIERLDKRPSSTASMIATVLGILISVGTLIGLLNLKTSSNTETELVRQRQNEIMVQLSRIEKVKGIGP